MKFGLFSRKIAFCAIMCAFICQICFDFYVKFESTI